MVEVALGGAAIAQRSEGRAYGLYWVLAFFVPPGVLWCRGEHRRVGSRRVFRSGMICCVVRVTDVAKSGRQGLVACRAALPFTGLLDARPGVAPAPPFGAVVRQSSMRRR